MSPKNPCKNNRINRLANITDVELDNDKPRVDFK